MLLNTYWHLPAWLRATIGRLFPKSNTHTLTMRLDESGVWTFSKFPIIRESICGGSEVVLSELFEQEFGREPQPEDRMDVTVSSIEPETYTTRVEYLGPDDSFPGSSYYNCTRTKKLVWLCPVLPVMMPGNPVPTELYVTLTNGPATTD